MRVLSKTLIFVFTVLLGATLASCSPLPSSPTGKDRSNTGEPSESADESQQQFFDNVVILKAGLAGFGPESDVLESYPDATWQESDAETRQHMAEVGQEACGATIPTSAAEPGDRYMIWLSAKFLCRDRLPEAEASLVEFTNDQMLKLLELARWRGDALPDDVLNALALCSAEVTIGWKIPEEAFPTKEFFCWFMRANAIEQNDSEADFIDMFREGGKPTTTFYEYAVELGAQPGGVTGLTD